MSDIKAIETTYRGFRFRSRLESRWAVFFDALCIPFEYEKEGFNLGEAGCYLPDFWLPRQEWWVEIKGQEPTHEEMVKARALSHQSEHPVIILGGPIDIAPEEDTNIALIPKTMTATVFLGEYGDEWFPWELIWASHKFGPVWRESLHNFLYEKEMIRPGHYEGLANPKKREATLVEIDKTYFKIQYGKEHHKYKYGRWSQGGCFELDDKGQLVFNLCSFFVSGEIMGALIKAKQAQFEFKAA